jgi:arabinose-5-phosphate isomerase
MLSSFEQISYARAVFQMEADALLQVSSRIGADFCEAVRFLLECRGSVIVTGIGKAGLIGQKVAATLSSTGTRSHFLHPSEAMHGDLGRLRADDVVLALSNSGETEELLRLLPALRGADIPLVAITACTESSLGKAAHLTLELGALKEACSLGLAPSTSTTAMLAMGDALALVTSRVRQFTREDFNRFHPGGNLGRKLSKVEDYMRPGQDCRVAGQWLTVRQVFIELSRPGRRTGAIMLTDDQGRLTGIFTDSDLARLFEGRRDGAFDMPVEGVMARQPRAVTVGSMMCDAVDIMAERKISELPVIDGQGRPVGLIDITDLVALIPAEATEQQDEASTAKMIPKPKMAVFSDPAVLRGSA